MKNMVCFLVLIGLAACAPATKKNDEAKYSYEYMSSQCSTRRHVFDSVDAMCGALKNDDLNGNCASNLRYEKFKIDCEGRSWN